MDEPISAMMRSPVITADMDDSAQRVESLMRDKNVSAVPVIDRATGAVMGLISARDLVQRGGQQRDPAATQAWEMCTYKPIEVSPDTSIVEVGRLMLARGIHHVVVVQNAQVIGMVSALDFVERFLRENEGGERA